MNKQIYSFTLDPGLIEKLEQLAIKRDRSKSYLLNEILKEYLNENHSNKS
jgi:predicted transcriptional regulator